mmetsp:Transcript_21023/g.32238  ORF Transcript_21023/g.32238 Transcript_21023/m.32238 type:complete len:692 (-) Transcript_21023:19-2094(-)
MPRLVEFRGSRYEVVEDHGVLLMLVLSEEDEESLMRQESLIRKKYRFRMSTRFTRRLGASLRRRRFVLAEREKVQNIKRENIALPLVPVGGKNVTANLPIALLKWEIGSALGCATCQAACATTCRKWAHAFDSGMGIMRSALHRTVSSSCRHDPGSLRARAVLNIAEIHLKQNHQDWLQRHVEQIALDDFDPRVRACALKAAKNMQLNVPLIRLRDAVYDDWKSRRNLAKYESWHAALRPLLEQEDWPAYERMVQAYSAVHAAGQRAALDVIGASFLKLWQKRIHVNQHDTEEEEHLVALVEFVSGLTHGYLQRRVARDAIASWDETTTQAYVEATIYYAFAPHLYRRRSHNQHQALIDMLIPASSCGPALAEAILLYLDDTTELQHRLAARHALQIVVDGHAHRVAFIAQRLLPAILHLADRKDYSRILHHLYHCCVPSTHAVLTSLKHALFCAAVALSIATFLALFVTLGNHFVCCLQLGDTGSDKTCPTYSPSTLSEYRGEGQDDHKDATTKEGIISHYSLTFEHAAACVTGLFPRWWHWFCDQKITSILCGTRSYHDTAAANYRPSSLVTSALSLISSAASIWTKRAFSDAAAGLVDSTSLTSTPGDFTPQPPLPGGFTWTEFTLIIMYSLFLPFLLVLHLVWLIDDFLVELQFLHCSRPFRDACVRGLLASIGGPPSTPHSLPSLS